MSVYGGHLKFELVSMLCFVTVLINTTDISFFTACWKMSVMFIFILVFYLHICFAFLSHFNCTNCVSSDAMWFGDWRDGQFELPCHRLHTLLTDLHMDQRCNCLDRLHSVPSSTERQRLYGSQSSPSEEGGLADEDARWSFEMCRDTSSGNCTVSFRPTK